MKVEKLGVANYRNINQIIIEPSDHLNFITGHNGAGKTSIIEALYYISYGKSFKTERLASLIQQNQDYFHLRCIIAYDQNTTYDIYIKQFKSVREIYINDELVKNQIEVARLIPLQIISPDTVQLLTLGPDERRKFLNWGMFYTFSEFNGLWKDFQKAHQSRNKILQRAKFYTSQNKPIPLILLHDLHNYIELVVKYSYQLDNLYQEYISKLLPVLQRILSNLLPELEIDVKFYRGWPITEDLQSLLENNLEHMLESGRVNVGLHRFDLLLRCYGELVQNVLSGGQLKLLSCALKLAQGELFKSINHNQCIFLVDDLAAELDETKQVLFAQQLLKDHNQIFMSYINNKDLNIFSDICKEWTEFAINKGQVIEKYVNGQLEQVTNVYVDDLIDKVNTLDLGLDCNNTENDVDLTPSSVAALDESVTLTVSNYTQLQSDITTDSDHKTTNAYQNLTNTSSLTLDSVNNTTHNISSNITSTSNALVTNSNLTVYTHKPTTNQIIDHLLEFELKSEIEQGLSLDGKVSEETFTHSDNIYTNLNQQQLYKHYLDKSHQNLNNYNQTKLYCTNIDLNLDYEKALELNLVNLTVSVVDLDDTVNIDNDNADDDQLPYMDLDLDK